jgi:U1 zinc finger
MADSDKNATNYWCKYCKTFVRNSPLEKRNHESSARHQGSLQRFLKDLHKTNDREAREKQRAKDEVARLNGLQPDSSASITSRPAGLQKFAGSSSHRGPEPPTRQATREERKQQMAQLAAMGVVVPQEFRKENAMAGQWESVAIQLATQLAPPLPSKLKAENDEGRDVKPDLDHLPGSDRKRKLEDGEKDTAWLSKAKRPPNWGSDVRKLNDVGVDDDLDALLEGSTSAIIRKEKPEQGANSSHIEEVERPGDERIAERDSRIKEENASEQDLQADPANVPEERKFDATEAESKDGDAEDIGSMFKKRKKKALRQD